MATIITTRKDGSRLITRVSPSFFLDRKGHRLKKEAITEKVQETGEALSGTFTCLKTKLV